MIADTPHTFGEGDVLFVPAETQHRFVDFADNLMSESGHFEPVPRNFQIAGYSVI